MITLNYIQSRLQNNKQALAGKYHIKFIVILL